MVPKKGAHGPAGENVGGITVSDWVYHSVCEGARHTLLDKDALRAS